MPASVKHSFSLIQLVWCFSFHTNGSPFLVIFPNGSVSGAILDLLSFRSDPYWSRVNTTDTDPIHSSAVQWQLYGEHGSHDPPERFLVPLLDPTFLERYIILNFEYIVCCKYLHTRNEPDTSRLPLSLTYTERLSSFLCVFRFCK